MSHRIVLASIIGFMFLIIGCQKSDEVIAFTGTWIIHKESLVTDNKVQLTVNVSVKNNQFRIVSRDEEMETIDLYDGKFLKHKETSLVNNDSINSPSPVETSIEKTENEVGAMKFWKNRISAAGMPGGIVAGRETVLYQSQENMLDNETTIQAWVDVETQVVLKKIFTVYSRQQGELMKKNIEECQEIHFGPVDNSLFNKL